LAEIISISFREDGARQVKGKILEIGGAAGTAVKQVERMNKVLKELRTIGGAFGALIIVDGLRQATAAAIDMADEMTNLRNRLSILADDGFIVAESMAAIRKIAVDSRSSLAATGELYTRVALSTRTLGTSAAEVATVVETANKAIILSGASSREASNGLIQLAQGLASNRLAGDELRSVLEQLPAVADLIARHLGVTRGELRALGRDGKLTTDVLIEAFLAAANTVENDFVKATFTVAQAREVFSTNMQAMIDDLNQMTGATEKLSTSIVGLGKDLKLIPAFLALPFGGVGAAVTTAAVRERLRRRQELLNLPKANEDLLPGTPREPLGLPFGGALPIREPGEDERRFLREFGAILNAEKEAIKTLKELEDERFERIQRMSQALGGGGPSSALGIPFPEAIEEVTAAVEPLSEEMLALQAAGVDAFTSIARAAIDAAVGIETSFAQTFESIATGLADLVLQNALVNLPGGLGNFFRGGRQHGGPTGGGGQFIIGERGPEVLTLPAGGRVDPIQPAAAPVVNIINITDPEEINRYIAGGKADRAILNRINRNPVAFGLSSGGK
jgi:tape measure domain-containing protein